MTICYRNHTTEITGAEAWRLFDHASQRWLCMTGIQFEKLYDAGDLPDLDSAKVMHVASLLNLSRQ